MRSFVRLLRPLSFLVALAVLAFVVVAADPAEVWRNLRGIDVVLALAAVLLNIPVAALVATRSFLVLKRMNYDVPLQVVAPASIVGNVAGTLTPAASGEFLRITSLQRSGGISVRDALALVAYERAFSPYLLLLTTGACLAFSSLPVGAAVAIAMLCLVCILVPAVVSNLVLPHLPDQAD